MKEKRESRIKKLDDYEDEIVMWLRDYPDMSTSQIFYFNTNSHDITPWLFNFI